MSVKYVPVLLNPFKKKYDVFLIGFIVLYLLCFFIVQHLLFPQLIANTIIIRAFGTLAIILLHVILLIGPLCRLNKRFLPLLYNRRHLGVSMFFVASVHAWLSLIWFHSGGNTNPFVSLFTSNTHYDSLRYFPFQTLGFFAYLILSAMAFTSHDFWLNYLSPKVWKALHMLVYLAYALVVMHVVLGIIQLESSPVLFVLLMLGLLMLSTLHIMAGYKEWKTDQTKQDFLDEHWMYVCTHHDIKEDCAKMVVANNERIAIFKYNNQLSAVHNVCKHQNGPLGEGKIVDGCITCPWHGYQYLPENGSAPAPFHEKIVTYALQLIGENIYVDVRALPEGTHVTPTRIPENNKLSNTEIFFIGWNVTSISPLIKKTAWGLLLASLFVGILFTSNVKHIANSSFDYDNLKSFSGDIVLHPFVALRTVSGRDIHGNPIVKSFPLVNAGKFGADDLIQNYLSKNNTAVYSANVTGAIIQRDHVQAIELSNGEESITALNNDFSIPAAVLMKVADTCLQGEIIDPKCYLGAMNPGEGKPHRSCAVRCISGGIMPMLTFSGKGNQKQYAVLLGENGEKINQAVLPYVAEPVKITGKLYRFDDWLVFYVNPEKSITRLFQ